MADSTIRVRVGRLDDWPTVHGLISSLFHQGPEARDIEGSVVEPDRTLLAEDAGTLVGHVAAYTRELTVPGAVLPAAHVTLVGVAPTHRRRGLLTTMMRRQLLEVAAAGREPVAVLWASETSIYPRFGYGPAARRLRLDIMAREVRPPAAAPGPPPRLRLVEPTAATAQLATVYDGLRAERIGWSSRDERWWRFVLTGEETRREGATALRGVLHDSADGPTGYALWRSVDRWDSHGPDAEVRVREVVAADPGTYAALWRFLLTIDLVRTVQTSFAALDEPLQYLVGEPRRLGASVADALWVRLVDLPRALAARRYAAPVDVVLDVTDPLLPANTGRWRLTAGADGVATCTATAADADLTCTVLELGAAYLGATSLAALAAAGSVHESTAGALAATATAFGWHRAPQATEVF